MLKAEVPGHSGSPPSLRFSGTRETGAEVGCCDGAVQAVYESYDNSTNLR